MDARTAPARPTRARYRHELRALAYLTLDEANGGIVRNLTDRGIGVQLMAPVRPGQRLDLRFELREPRLRVEARGEVAWSTFSGQCGIRFLDLPPRLHRQINEWILGNLLEGISLHSPDSIFAMPTATGPDAESAGEWPASRGDEGDDGLVVSATPVKVIELPMRKDAVVASSTSELRVAGQDHSELDWLSQPLSGRGLALTIDTLIIVAGALLVAVVFLSVIREAPPWPFAMALADVILVAGLYWGLFQILGGGTVGTRLAHLAGSDEESDQPLDARFR